MVTSRVSYVVRHTSIVVMSSTFMSFVQASRMVTVIENYIDISRIAAVAALVPRVRLVVCRLLARSVKLPA